MELRCGGESLATLLRFRFTLVAALLLGLVLDVAFAVFLTELFAIELINQLHKRERRNGTERERERCVGQYISNYKKGLGVVAS